MSGAQIKIFVAVVALLLLGGIVLGGWIVVETIFKPEIEGQRQIRQVLNDKTSDRPDPGRGVYSQAIDLIRRQELDQAKEKLIQVLRVYPDSAAVGDARRVLGEMNLDRIFSRTPMPGKLEYTVAPGEPGLEAIARKNRSTIAFLRRVNNISGSTIHPGDRLVVYPLDFDIEVQVANKILVLNHKGDFVKSYPIKEFNLAAGQKLPTKTYVASKSAYAGDKVVRESDARYPMARKWIQTAGRGGRAGVILCAAPKKPDDGTPNGIYFDESDMEELNTLVRPRIIVQFTK